MRPIEMSSDPNTTPRTQNSDTSATTMMQQTALFLMYHRVAPGGPASYPYTVTPQRFKEQLDVVAAVEASRDESPLPCGLTFDDGHESNYDPAMALLATSRRKARFFVTAGWIGTRVGFMRWPQVKELLEAGHLVGSHGWSHKNLTRCSEEELQVELSRSKNELEQRLGRSIESISMPGGRWNARVLRACAEFGYRQVFTSDPETVIRFREGIQILPRFIATQSLTASRLRRLLRTGNHLLYSARLAHQAKEAIRWSLGDKLYHRVWCLLSGWKCDEESTVPLK
ncbi:polysaccharide deacetylase family protein [Acidobacteria bacterium AB60]|nr:polysaccharide deacetylase family protein [Acidobacteria bacterium AB60]